MEKFTQKEISAHLFISDGYLRNLIRDGIVQKNCTLDEAREAYIKYLQGIAKTRKIVKEDYTQSAYQLEAEKARETFHKANLAEIQEKKERENLIEKDFIGNLLAVILNTVKTKLLAIPTKFAPRAVGKKVKEIEILLKDYIREVLEELVKDELEVFIRRSETTATAAKSEDK